MEPRFCSVDICNERKSSLIEILTELYKTLGEAEQLSNRLGTGMFALPSGEVAMGTPDCMETHVRMALEMAELVRNELRVICERSGC